MLEKSIKEGDLKYSGGKIGVVVGRFNDDITSNLLKGTLYGLKKYGVPGPDGDNSMIEVIRVPGAFEIPLVAKKMLQGGCSVVITLGVVIKGDTDHYEYVCKECADGIMQVQLSEGKPIIFEVLMVEDVELAEKRAVVPMDADGNIIEEGPGAVDWMKNKGYIAALNALEMMDLCKK